MTLVFLYETWDVEHRSRFAEAIGCQADEIKIPALGDLRLLRNLILHSHGVITEDAKRRLEVLNVGDIGSLLALDNRQMGAVIEAIMDSISEWAFAKFGARREPPSITEAR